MTAHLTSAPSFLLIPTRLLPRPLQVHSSILLHRPSQLTCTRIRRTLISRHIRALSNWVSNTVNCYRPSRPSIVRTCKLPSYYSGRCVSVQSGANGDGPAQPELRPIYEPNTGTWQYIVADPVTKDAAIIDSVLDFDIATSTITTSTADSLLDIVKRHNYKINFILETHAHADHLTASKYIQQTIFRAGNPKPKICIGKRITQVQHIFARRYRIDEAECIGVFDKLLDDGERLPLGNLEIEVLHLPGHTPDHVGYMIGSNVFVGDSLFPPDVGSARCDFPGGDATALFTSMSKLLSLPPDFRLYSGHDYPPVDRKGPRAFATVAEQRAKNKHVHDGVSMDEFVRWRTQRDATLGAPRLLHQALQFNIRAGQLPAASEHGYRFFHVPLKVSDHVWTSGPGTQG